MGFADNEKLTIDCQKTAGSDYYAEVPIYFVVEKPSTPLPAEEIPGDSKNISETDKVSTREKTIPLGGVSFNASILSGTMSDKRNPDDDSDEYKGIITPQDEWCTDSCGKGRIKMIPHCEEDANEVSLLITSGAAASKAFAITVQP